MAFNFSEKTKNLHDFIRAYGSFLGILCILVSLLFAFDLKDIDFNEMTNLEILLIQGFGLLIVIVPIIIYRWDKLRIRYVMFRGNLKGFIIEKQDILIDIQDNGAYATFFQKTYFHKYNRKSKDKYVTKIHVTGDIDSSSVQTVNCDYSFIDLGKSHMRLAYVNNIKKLNGLKNYFKQNDKFLFFYAVLRNSFLDTEESWDIDVINLCQDYNLQILLPPEKKLKYAKFIRVNKTTNDEFVDDIQPIVIQELTRQRIVLQIMNFDKNENYKIVWA